MVTANYNAVEWSALDPDERARAVAFYRLRRLEEIHNGDAVAAHQERAAKRGNRR